MLIGLVLVAALNSAGMAVRTANQLSARGPAGAYAAELLEEVLAMPYHDPQSTGPDDYFGIEPGEPSSPVNRLAFDDVDDYDGWSEPSALTWRDGAARLDTAGWGRSVEVVKISLGNASTTLTDGATDTGARRVTVTVTSPTGETTSLSACRSLGGALQQAPAVDTNCVTAVMIDLTSSAGNVSQAVSILNHAAAP
ncbi:MAG: hypothetical protein AAF790_10225 [Planctomycetota bacterium]